MFETNATHGRRALTPEEQTKVLQDKEYRKYFGGEHRKALVRTNEWPIEKVEECIKSKTEAFVQTQDRHPSLANIASDIDWKNATERFDVLTCYYPVKAIVGSDHSQKALKEKFKEICQEQKYMTMKHLKQAVERVAKANDKKEGKTVHAVDETKLRNTMKFLMQAGRLVQHHTGVEQPDAGDASSSSAQVDEGHFVRACQRENKIKRIVKFWRTAKQRRSAAEAMELCKKWINFPKEDQMKRFLALTNGMSGQWVVDNGNEVQCECARARTHVCACQRVCVGFLICLYVCLVSHLRACCSSPRSPLSPGTPLLLRPSTRCAPHATQAERVLRYSNAAEASPCVCARARACVWLCVCVYVSLCSRVSGIEMTMGLACQLV